MINFGRGVKGRSQAIAVTPDPKLNIYGPYADVGPMDGGAPPPPQSFYPAVSMVLPTQDGIYDIRQFSIPIGFDFTKRQIVGI